jgi:electron transfer flavoprotein alpha subunit
METGVVVFGQDQQDRASRYVSRGAKRVYIPGTGKEELERFDAGLYAEAIAQIARNNQAAAVLVGCTRNGKELAGRLAQKLEAGCINDVSCIQVKDGQLICTRNGLGGATVLHQSVQTPVGVYSVMPASFEPSAEVIPDGEMIEVDVNLKPTRFKQVEVQAKTAEAVNLTEAKILVCVGMGLGSQENLAVAEELAEALGGEIACSKPVATDKKWLSEARLIGLSGNVCKPQLAVCLGISGQVQFMVGIRDAKTIVAVNTDENASIFQMSDYGLVGDLFQIVPKLVAQIKQ